MKTKKLTIGKFKNLEVKRRRMPSSGELDKDLSYSTRIAYKDAWRKSRQETCDKHVYKEMLEYLKHVEHEFARIKFRQDFTLTSKTHVSIAAKSQRRVLKKLQKLMGELK